MQNGAIVNSTVDTLKN